MTRTYERANGALVSFTVYPGDNDVITVSSGKICNTVKVISNPNFVFKLNKKSISAKDGATGLFNYLDRCLYEHFCECYAWRVIDYALGIQYN